MTEKTFRGLGPVEFEGVRGVGTMQVDFEPGQQVYALIGENGVGKTKFLECLFATLLFRFKDSEYPNGFPFKEYSFKGFPTTDEESLRASRYLAYRCIFDYSLTKLGQINLVFPPNSIKITLDDLAHLNFPYEYSLPFIYLATHERGIIRGINSKRQINTLGTRKERRYNYLKDLSEPFFTDNEDRLKELNMNTNIHEWFAQRAQSANPYQSQEDNREIEIKVLLKLLNQLDGRIDPKFLEIDGANNVEIKIEGEKRQLSKLSSGFTSLLKVIQSIIASYGYLTNAEDLDQVQGIVLVDEIESHLHTSWQLKIFPLLKRLFPNTTFVVSTHSPIIISSLAEGEAYRLQRDADGVVRGRKIPRPNQTALVDLLQEAFGVSINEIRLDRLKLEQLAENGQKKAKEELAKLVEEELNLLD